MLAAKLLFNKLAGNGCGGPCAGNTASTYLGTNGLVFFYNQYFFALPGKSLGAAEPTWSGANDNGMVMVVNH